MAIVAREEHFLSITDEEDALLDEAICYKANNSETCKTEQPKKPDITLNLSRPLWCDMDVDSNGSDISNSKSANHSGSISDQSLVEIEKDSPKEEPAAVDNKIEIPTESKDKKAEKRNSEELVKENGLSNGNFDRKRVRQSTVEEERNGAKQFRSRADSGSTHSSSSAQSNGSTKRVVEYETDPLVLARRQKDIDYGKNTIGYDRYIQLVPKDKRTKEHPRTPPLHIKNSRRGWDGVVKIWRKHLHLFDPVETNDKVSTEEDKPSDSNKTDNVTQESKDS